MKGHIGDKVLSKGFLRLTWNPKFNFDFSQICKFYHCKVLETSELFFLTSSIFFQWKWGNKEGSISKISPKKPYWECFVLMRREDSSTRGHQLYIQSIGPRTTEYTIYYPSHGRQGITLLSSINRLPTLCRKKTKHLNDNFKNVCFCWTCWEFLKIWRNSSILLVFLCCYSYILTLAWLYCGLQKCFPWVFRGVGCCDDGFHSSVTTSVFKAFFSLLATIDHFTWNTTYKPRQWLNTLALCNGHPHQSNCCIYLPIIKKKILITQRKLTVLFFSE